MPKLTAEDLSVFRFRKGGSTQYFTTGLLGTAKTTYAITANRLYAIPFFTPIPLKIDELAIHVSTGVVGSARLGIYVDDGTIKPGRLLIDAGQVTTSPAEAKTLTVALTLARKKLHWLALVASVAPTLGAIVSASALKDFFSISDLTYTSWCTHIYRTFTYAPLPDPFGGTLTLPTATIPLIFVRAA